MATITTRAGKGAPLTNAEVDANFTGLNDELATKTTTAQAAAAAPVQSVAGKTGVVTLGPADVGAAAASHTHTKAQITDLSLSWTDITSKPTTFTPSAHSHAIADVTGLQTALDGKAASSHTHLWSHITDKPTTFAPSAHNHDAGNITSGTVSLDRLPTAVRNLTQGSSTQDPNIAIDPVILTNHSNSPSTSYYWHITTTYYSSISSSGNRAQIAVQYNGGNQVYARSCFNNVWTAWVRCDNDGNAATATKLATARSISLAGDVTGSASFDGSANISITATVADDSHNHTIASVDGLQAALDGKAASSHSHSYLPLSGGTLSGNLTVPSVYASNWLRTTGSTGWYSETYAGGIYMVDTTWVRVYNGKALYVANQIAATGNVTAYYSDKRLKENIRPIFGALSAVCSLQGVRYNANELAASFGYDRSKQEVGLLAQEVQAVLPEVVELAPFDLTDKPGESRTGEHYLTLKYERMIPVLIEAIKELKAEVDLLRAQING